MAKPHTLQLPASANGESRTERRSAFRRLLDGRVSWRPAGEAQADPSTSLAAQYYAMDTAVQQALAGLTDVSGPVRDILGLMQRQSRLLAMACFDSPHEIAERQVLSLSRCGIAFVSDLPATPGDAIELRVELSDEGLRWQGAATLTRCTVQRGRYLLGARFRGLGDAVEAQLHRVLLQDQRLRRSVPTALQQPLRADPR